MTIRPKTPNELWIDEQIKRINPRAQPFGNDGEYISALELLALEQRREWQRMTGEAGVMRDLLDEAYEVLQTVDSEEPEEDAELTRLRGAIGALLKAAA